MLDRTHACPVNWKLEYSSRSDDPHILLERRFIVPEARRKSKFYRTAHSKGWHGRGRALGGVRGGCVSLMLEITKTDVKNFGSDRSL